MILIFDFKNLYLKFVDEFLSQVSMLHIELIKYLIFYAAKEL